MSENRRKYERFKTEAEVFFQVAYDIHTKVRYQVLRGGDKTEYRKYLAVGKNVSAQGIAFRSFKKLQPGDRLYIEVYLPGTKEPIYMEGEVRWSSHIAGEEEEAFNTGVQLEKVGGKGVKESIYLDTKNNVTWSIVLESIFGTFKSLQKELKNNSGEERQGPV